MKGLRTFFACFGILLVLLAAVAARLGLSSPVTVGVGRVVVLAAGVAILLASVLARERHLRSGASAVRAIAGTYTGLATVLLTALLLLGLGEGACFLINQRYLYLTDPRAELPYYRTQAWAGRYWREHARAFGQTRYEPFVVWRTAPFHGETINIDADGIRSTPNAGIAANSYKVFAFGGSAMLGIGAPDWGTIPAFLQEDMKHRFPAVSVTNFGEKGWVSTQSVVLLMRQLQAGNIPDLAVFYEGPNDALFALENGKAGSHAGQQRTAMLLEHPLVGALLDTNFSKFFLPRLARLAQHPRPSTPDERLASDVAGIYLANYRTVEALASKYGFKFEFFLQPIISTSRKTLTAEEKRMRSEMDYTAPGFAELVGRVYEIIGKRAPDLGNFRSLTGIYDDQSSQVWIDWIHVTPEGNRLAAAAMADVLR